jgi:hypothetical protein
MKCNPLAVPIISEAARINLEFQKRYGTNAVVFFPGKGKPVLI